MTRAPRLGACGVVAAHDLAGAAAADALVALAAVDLGELHSLCILQTGLERSGFRLGGGGPVHGRIGDGRDGEAGGDECERGEQR